MKVAVQMDPIEKIDITADSTFAMMLEAQNRGHDLFYYLPRNLLLLNGRVEAEISPVTVRPVVGDHVAFGEPMLTDLSEMDVVLLRQDPPFDMNYITTTHILEHIHPQTLVVNDPFHVRNAPEKLFALHFEDLLPPTLITADEAALRAFWEVHKDIIIKPLYGNGGHGIIRIRPDDQNFNSMMEIFADYFKVPMIAQTYLPAVRQGDKRVILVEGEAVGAINRVPAAHDNRSNMHVGGKAEPCEMTERDLEICKAIGPELKRRGLIFVGIDVIGDKLTEINVTSPTGIQEVKRFGGADIAALIWEAIEERRKGMHME